MSDRELTQEEIDLAPKWETHYMINEGSVIYSSYMYHWWVGLKEPIDSYFGMNENAKPIPRQKIDITEHEFSYSDIVSVEPLLSRCVNFLRVELDVDQPLVDFEEKDIDAMKAHSVAIRGGNHE